MRKLVLSMIIAFLSAGAYAQTTDCTANESNPAIGATYTYEVNTAQNGFTGNGKYHWYITKETDLLNGTKENATNDFFYVVGGNATYDDANNTNKRLKLTWKPDALTNGNPFYLVIRYTETKDNCESSNMKAMKIKPLNNFKLKVTPVKDADGATFNAGEEKVCAAGISSAQVLANGKVKYEYGKTTLYYKVEMSGYTGSWKPTISLPELQGKTGTDAEFIGRKYESVEWKAGGSTFETFSDDFTEGASVTNLLAKTATTQNSFIVKVVVNNGTYEGLTNEDISLSTKGNMVLANNSLGARDVKDDCSDITNDSDNRKGTQVILARPEIQAQSGGFIIQIQ
ncbi:hypothetical protein [Capnocytophaga canis]|uniref:Uncharacterized protein n=1 Tax=Capnocytophaga canis TaxID=1848903 RepID=A0A0B7IL25_9FLAO|nr:hypothetical protein [Capnocytophaga canis]CEN51254.1 conserved exported hypothetical protein [Capnocytophaga canis]